MASVSESAHQNLHVRLNDDSNLSILRIWNLVN